MSVARFVLRIIVPFLICSVFAFTLSVIVSWAVAPMAVNAMMAKATLKIFFRIFVLFMFVDKLKIIVIYN